MQPITKPAAPTIRPTYSTLVEALALATGRFCAFCEKALTFSAGLFDKRHGVVDRAANLSLNQWPDLLLICGECERSAAGFDTSRRYLWPDTTEAQSIPFRYVRRDNVVFRIIAPGGAVLRTEQRSYVLAEVANDLDASIAQAAANTLQLFKLNTPFYSSNPQPQVEIPYQDYMDASDVRLDQRMQAYRRAVNAAQRLDRAFPTLVITREFINNLLAGISDVIDNTGYISTWQAALVDNLPPATRIAIFAPGTQATSNRKRTYDEVVDDLVTAEQDRPTAKRRREIWPGPPLVPPLKQ